MLVDGTIPQKRVLMLAPNMEAELEAEMSSLRKIFEQSMEY
jgi:hydroxyacid-oxoacid transhydrogenase